MIEPASYLALRKTITQSILADRGLLDALRAEIRPLRDQVRHIQPRVGSAVPLVAADGGNNQLAYDPFRIQLVRVVDSANNELCLKALTPALPLTRAGQTRPGARPLPAGHDAGKRAHMPLSGRSRSTIRCKRLKQ